MPSLPIEGWAVAHVELERPLSAWSEPDQVFLLRSPRCWTLVTLSPASRPCDGEPSSPGRATLSAEPFPSIDDLADAVRDRYHATGWVRLLDAGQDDPDLYPTWAPTRVERDFDRASLHDPELAWRGTGRQIAGWHLSAVEHMARHLEADGFGVARLRVVVDIDDDRSANPVLGVVSAVRYGVETPGVVRVDDAGEVYVRPPFDAPVGQWDLVDVSGFGPSEAAGATLEW